MQSHFFDYTPSVYNQKTLFICTVDNQFGEYFLLTVFLSSKDIENLANIVLSKSTFAKIRVPDSLNFQGDFFFYRSSKVPGEVLRRLSTERKKRKIDSDWLVRSLLTASSACYISSDKKGAFLLTKLTTIGYMSTSLSMIKERSFTCSFARNSSSEFDTHIETAKIVFASLCFGNPFFIDSIESYLHALDYMNLFRLKEINQAATSITRQIIDELKDEPIKERHPYYAIELSPTPKELLRDLKRSQIALDVLLKKERFRVDEVSNLHIRVRLSVEELEETIAAINDQHPDKHLSSLGWSKRDDALFYRGVTSPLFSETPALFRNGYRFDSETERYRETKRLFPKHFQNLTYLEALTEMQHFELPTRLLDITSNPLVALFFACAEGPSQKGQAFGEVICYFPESNQNQDEVKFCDSYRILPLSALPLIESEEKKGLFLVINACKQKSIGYKELRECLLGQKPINSLMMQSNQNAAISDHDLWINPHFIALAKTGFQKLIRLVKAETPSFDESLFNPYDLLNPYYVKAGMINERIAAQSGCFIISGLDIRGAESKLSSSRNVQGCRRMIVINKASLLRELRQLNITFSTLMPDLEHLGKVFSSEDEDDYTHGLALLDYQIIF